MKSKLLFGEYVHRKRLEKNISLRQFCKENNYDPAYISRVERGLLAPPSDKERLEKMAKSLQIRKGTSDYRELLERASICKGEIPEEFLGDESLLEKLPAIFRTVRGKKLSSKELDIFIEMIRKA